jgi:hypothetical protein
LAERAAADSPTVALPAAPESVAQDAPTLVLAPLPATATADDPTIAQPGALDPGTAAPTVEPDEAPADAFDDDSPTHAQFAVSANASTARIKPRIRRGRQK